MMVWTHLVYVAVSIAATVWVGGSLHRNGRVFLLANFHAQEKLADSVNHLLLGVMHFFNMRMLVRFRGSRLFGDFAPEVATA